MSDFNTLIDAAEQRPFIGWDTTCDGRFTTASPWDFTTTVAARAQLATDLLDLGTGGGEWLSRLPVRPRLERLHRRSGHDGPLRLREPLFWLAARKLE